jgi:hemerythrin superfamily protein
MGQESLEAGPSARRWSGVQPGKGAEAVDAIEMLEAQHRAVEGLFRALSWGPRGTKLRDKLSELAAMVLLHDAIESRLFYPAARAAAAETEQELRRSLEDHLDVKRVLATVMAANPSDLDLLPQVEELEGLLEEHVIEEEHELFPRVRRLMSRDRLLALGQQMAATMAELQQQGDLPQRLLAGTDQPAQV